MALGTLRAARGMYRQLRRAFKVLGCLGEWGQATNGILQGCPLSVIFINMLTTVWKREIDELRVGFGVQVRDLPPRRVVGSPLSVPAMPPRAAPASVILAYYSLNPIPFFSSTLFSPTHPSSSKAHQD